MNDKARNEREDIFLQAARRELEESCARLDGSRLSRLNHIRHRALERRKRDKPRIALLAPFGGLVTACVLVFAVILMRPESAPTESVAPGLPVEDIEILSSADLELYEDFEFYQWLAENGSAI